MTNTGDFRRYSYASDTAYALKAFDVHRSSAAPAYQPDTKRDIKVREGSNKKSIAELKKEQKLAFATVFKIVTVASLCLAMLFGVIYTHAQKNELTNQISKLETQLAISKSENTRINSELDALVSMSMIDRYAVEELGMTKMKSNQIRYIDVSQYKEKHEKSAGMLLQDRAHK
jgi:cell division protein FtsL